MWLPGKGEKFEAYDRDYRFCDVKAKNGPFTMTAHKQNEIHGIDVEGEARKFKLWLWRIEPVENRTSDGK